MDTKKLRQKILDLAIRGKLVPQDPNDEPASVLLDRIRAEKERLIAEGKIKRPKKSKATSADKSQYQNFEPPFEIPESWEWVRLGEIANQISAGGDKPSNYSRVKTSDFSIPIYANGIENDGLYGYTNQASVYKNSITVSARGTIGFCKIRNHPYFPIVRLISVVPNQLISIEYLYFALTVLIDKGEGSSIPQLTVPSITETLIPIPPLQEQIAIINAINAFYNFIDLIEVESKELEGLLSLTKSKILDLAMQGKLVPQDPSDESAAEMLRRINPKAEIITDNPHYGKLPDNWAIGLYKTFIKVVPSKAFQISQKEICESGKYPVVSQGSALIEGYSNNAEKVFRNTNGIVIFGDHTRNVKLMKNDFIVGADGVKLILWNYDIDYLYYLTRYVAQKIENRGYSRHFQYLCSEIVGVPPVNEQQRIVAKIEELYSILDEIEKSLTD